MGRVRVLALVLIVMSGVAGAQPSAKDRQRAGDLVKQAIAKSQAGDHEPAVELYLDAYKIIPQPLLLSNIGSEYQQLKRPIEALKYFCKYLEADGPNGTNASYAVAQARTLYIELGGISAVADQDVCKPIVKPAAKPIDKPTDKPVDKPLTRPALPVGSGAVADVTPAPALDPGPPAPVDQSAQRSPLRIVGIGLSVVGAGVFGLGVYYGVQAKSISDEITNHPMTEPWTGTIQDREAEGRSAEKKQIGFMIGGGVAIAAGTALFFLAAPKKTAEGVTLAPIATTETLGVVAAGRF